MIGDLLIENSVKSLGFYPEDIHFLKIFKIDFMNMMKGWCAFSASDINENNFLDIKELKILLWIYTDKKPDDFKVQK